MQVNAGERYRIGQMAERLGSQVVNQQVAGSIPGHTNHVVSLGKSIHPACLGENVPVLTVSHSGEERLLND